MAYSTIDDPTLYFNTVLYAGTGSEQTVSGVNFQPDFTWLKSRTNGRPNTLQNSVTGATKQMHSNATDSETSYTQLLKSFNSDGFVLGTDAFINQSSQNFVSWNWKAGGSASSNTAGSINSSVSVNQESGFSIVSFSGTEANGTVGHGLGTTPKFIFGKNRDTATSAWPVYSATIGATKYLNINTTGAQGTFDGYWNNTNPTSSVFSVGSHPDVNRDNMIYYCFAEKKGYSKIGSYIPNGGGSDNTFIYLGFSPAFIMAKGSTFGSAWTMVDNRRSTHNVVNSQLFANNSNAEDNSTSNLMCDFLSNGFKIKSNNGAMGSSGQTYIYMAFAENPFVTSTGIPTTAR